MHGDGYYSPAFNRHYCCIDCANAEPADICQHCDSQMVVVGPGQRTYCYTCGDFTINLPLFPKGSPYETT